MEQNSLFPLKYRLRKTDEPVEIVAWDTLEKGARSHSDWVSYIDSQGNEHIKEQLTLEWDFVIDSPFEKIISGGFGSSLPAFDPWEARRYELVKEMFLSDKYKGEIGEYVEVADEILAALKKPQEAEEEYDNIGVGEIVEEEVEGLGLLRKFVFTDKKDIVGFSGDRGRWAVGDKVKVYIKKYDPKKGL